MTGKDLDKLATRALLDDDEEAWTLLVTKIWPVLLKAARNNLSDENDAENVVQAALMAICEKRKEYSGKTFLAWALCITRNASIDMGRKVKRIQNHEGVGMDLANTSDSAEGPQGLAERDEERVNLEARLLYCLKRLTDSQKEAFLLRFGVKGEVSASQFPDKLPSIASIARKLKVTDTSVLGRLDRATRNLRKCLGDNVASSWGIHVR